MESGPLFDQFIDDYFAECDEHLAAVRRTLLALEERGGSAPWDPEQLRGLLRNLHTLKGLSGMVGFADAEGVAHALEDWLRTAAAPGRAPGAEGLEVLFSATRLLEECVAARRLGSAPPDTSGLLAELCVVAAPEAARVEEVERAVTAGRSGASQLSPPEEARARAAVGAGADLLDFEFVPTPELAARGVGVEVIRGRLQGLGELIHASPRVLDGGGIAFRFIVAAPPGAGPDVAWRDDGLRWSPCVVEPVPEPGAARPAEGGSATSALPVSPSNVVRVDLARLDDLMRLVGDLVISRSRMEDVLDGGAVADPGSSWDALQEINAAMERQLRDLREGVMRVRLVPVGEVFERMRFVVREVAREVGRQVAVALEGQGTEIDKLVVERMLEPLLHLVRNAVSHGIESPEERLSRGKPAEGRITLRAFTSGERVVIEVEDDGAGIDLEAVTSRARSHGLIGPDERVDEGSLVDVLSAPGFSTRDVADLASGRGVGMGVVRGTVRGVGGELSVASGPGGGTCFTIELPLTLMIVDALLVAVGDQTMAVPQPALQEVLQVDPSAVTPFENNEVVRYRGGVLPLLRLRRLFGLPPGEARATLNVLVVGTDSQRVGLVVDRLAGLREIVVRSIADPLVAVPGIAGAAELGDGRLSLILDAAELARIAREGLEQEQRRQPAVAR